MSPFNRPLFRRFEESQILKALTRIVVFLFVVNVLLGTYVVKTLPRVASNTSAIREAGYETCARGNGVRAEFQFRAGLTPNPAAVKRLVKQFHLRKNVVGQTSLKAERKRLPLYDCRPLLHNKPAIPLTVKQQERYVKKFVSGKKRIPPPMP